MDIPRLLFEGRMKYALRSMFRIAFRNTLKLGSLICCQLRTRKQNNKKRGFETSSTYKKTQVDEGIETKPK